MKEIWKDIEGYEGLYQVSNLGRVKRLKRFKKNHSKLQLVPEKILNQTLSNNGYYMVGISVNKMRKCFLVHRLIAKSFIDNPYNYDEVNHKDGNKLNNSINNLEWCTQKQNVIHSYNNCLNSRKKKVKQLDKNRNVIKIWNSVTEAQKFYKNTSISAVCRGKRKYACGFIWEYLL